MDLRLKDMPDDLTREQQSEYIIKHCNLKDPMWHFVWVLSKKKSNVRFQCKLCGEEGTSAGVFTGGPAKIRCHFLANMFGCVTCTGVGEEREKANEASQQSVDDEVAAKQKRDLEKKRKHQIEEGRLAEQNRLKQQKLEGSLSGAGTVDYTKEGLDQLWAKAVYAAPTSFNLLKNPFVVEAIEATSRFLLPPSSRKVDVVEQQPKYTPPSPDRLGGTLRTSISKSTSDRLCALQNTEAVKYGINATSDGWSSNPQHRPIEAQLFETPTVTRLNHAEDLSGETKSEIKIAQKLGQWADKGCDDMGVPKSTNDFMCVDGAEIASVNLLMAGAEENGIKLEPRPWLSGGVCTPHSLDLELEDIDKLPFVSSHMEEVFAYISSESAASLRARTSSVRARTSIIFLPPVFCVPSQKKRCIKFIREHQYSLWLWREHAENELLNPCATRFATNFIMADSLQDQKDSGGEMVADRRYMQWLNGEGTRRRRKKSYYAEGIWVRSKMQDGSFWEMGAMIQKIVYPIIELLRLADSELPLMGKVYHRMSQIASHLESAEFEGLTRAQRNRLESIHADRWSYLHNHYHAAGFALDPEFSREAVHANREIMSGFQIVCDRVHFASPAKAALAKQQFLIYKNRSQGVFMEPGIIDTAARSTAGHLWWEMYGYEVPELQMVAMKVLSKRSSACSVERLWSLFGLIWTKSRASLGAAKAIDLVKTGANLRLEKKLMALDYETEMRSWTTPPEESEDEDDEDDEEEGGVE